MTPRPTIMNAMTVGLVCAAECLSAQAAPMVKTQAPGYYRMMVGQFEVTALNDGVIPYLTRDGASDRQAGPDQGEPGWHGPQ